jgi:hypothetical protein
MEKAAAALAIEASFAHHQPIIGVLPRDSQRQRPPASLAALFDLLPVPSMHRPSVAV